MSSASLFIMVTSMAVAGLDGARSCYFVDGTYQTPRKVTCTQADNQYCFTMTGTIAEVQKGCADDTTYGLRSKNITCTQNGKNPVPATLDLPQSAELDCCDTDYCNDSGGNAGGPTADPGGPGGSGPRGPGGNGPGGHTADPGGSGPGGSGPGSPGGKSPGGSGDRGALVSLSLVSLAVAMLFA